MREVAGNVSDGHQSTWCASIEWFMKERCSCHGGLNALRAIRYASSKLHRDDAFYHRDTFPWIPVALDHYHTAPDVCVWNHCHRRGSTFCDPASHRAHRTEWLLSVPGVHAQGIARACAGSLELGRKCGEASAPPCQPNRERPQITTSRELWPFASLTPLLLLTRPVGPLICRLEGDPFEARLLGHGCRRAPKL